jgi:hypothetical protein
MAGRPRTTLKRLDKLIQYAEDYGNDLYDLMPAQYLEQNDTSDATRAAWRRAADAAVESCLALYALREMLVQKVERAGVNGRTANRD